jgi:hypothetical protein
MMLPPRLRIAGGIAYSDSSFTSRFSMLYGVGRCEEGVERASPEKKSSRRKSTSSSVASCGRRRWWHLQPWGVVVDVVDDVWEGAPGNAQKTDAPLLVPSVPPADEAVGAVHVGVVLRLEEVLPPVVTGGGPVGSAQSSALRRAR